jgi:biotin carboxylase
VARGRVVRSPAEARALIRKTGYPVIAKPDAGVGALNTYRIDAEADLDPFFKSKPAVDYLMEEFVSGVIHSFDGLADADGNPLFCTGHVFSQGIMETVNEARHIYYYSMREIPAELERIGRACLKSFGVKERFFHIEFFLTASGEYVALEVNMRPPGGYTTDMFNYGADIDVYRAWAQLLVHGSADLVYTRKYHCCYASRKFNQSYRYSHAEILARFGHRLVEFAENPPVFSDIMGRHRYIFRSENEAEIRGIAAAVRQTGQAS